MWVFFFFNFSKFLNNKKTGFQALDKHGITPILAAIWEGHINCVKELLKNGASKTGKAPDGTSYIDSAESAEIKQLLGWTKNKTPN